MKSTILFAALIAASALSCQNSNPASNNTTTAASTDTTNHYKLETVFTDSTYQFTGIAKEQGGRLFLVYPRWSPIYRYAVATAKDSIGVTPYPTAEINNWQTGQAGENKWVCVQSMYIDDKGDFWVIDPAAPMLKTIQGKGAKLVKLDKNSGAILKNYNLTATISDTSYANDVRIDAQNSFAYVTDSKTGGIIVVNLATGAMREVLKGDKSTVSDTAYHFTIDGRELMKNGKTAKFNSDGIALTPNKSYLYYKPLTDDKLYRIKTSYLRDFTMRDSALSNRVEDLGHFNTTDGMMFDKKGNLYMGDLEKYEIVKLDSSLHKTVIVKDSSLIWPDTYSMADGYLYFTCSQINKQPDYNNGVNRRTTPYKVFRIKL
ncbi:MAG: major royal jelly family protein [Bacteroidota bacterium]|nr:major royal jelly family protein [Bacteroidota bacterium]